MYEKFLRKTGYGLHRVRKFYERYIIDIKPVEIRKINVEMEKETSDKIFQMATNMSNKYKTVLIPNIVNKFRNMDDGYSSDE